VKLDKELINKEVSEIVSSTGKEKKDVIPILHSVQEKYNYLPQEALRKICELTEITPAEIEGIATFYDQFRLEPVGEHIVSVCTGTACHVKGAGLVFDTFLRLLGIKQGKDTDEKGKYTVQKVACLGCCTIAPVVQIDDITYGHVKTDNVEQILKDFESHGKGIIKPVDKEQTFTKEIGEIKIGLGSCCVASGSDKVRDALEESFKDAAVVPEIKKVGCVGMCHRVPLLEVCLPNEEPKIYDKVKPEEVKKIVAKHFELGSFTKRLKSSTLGFFENILYDEDQRSFQRHYKDVREKDIKAFLQKQFRIATEFSGEIDPLDLDEYRSHKGFSTLENILKEKSQKEIISEIKESSRCRR